MIRHLALLLCLGAGPVAACTVGLDTDLTTARQAEIVLAGTVTEVEFTEFGAMARFVVAPDLVIRGDAAETQEFVWLSGMAFGPDPRLMQAGAQVIVAAGAAPVTTENYSPWPDLPVVLQQICSRGYVLADTAENRAAVLAALGG